MSLFLILALVAGLGVAAIGGIHGKHFALNLLDPWRFFEFIFREENRTFLMGLGVVAAFLGARSLLLFWQAAHHVAAQPGTGFWAGLKAANPRSFGFLLLFVATSAAVQAGSMLVLAPGVYLAVKLSLAGMAYTRDGEGLLGAIKASWRLTDGRFWELLIRMIVVGIVAGLLAFIPPLGLGLWLAATALIYEELAPVERRKEPRDDLSPFGAVERPLDAAPPAAAPAEAVLAGEADLAGVLRESWSRFAARWPELLLVTLAAAGATLGVAAAAAGAGYGLVAALPGHEAALIALAALLGLAGMSWTLGWGALALMDAVYAPERLKTGEALRGAKAGAWRMSGVMALQCLVIAGGYLLFAVPGLLFSVWFAFAPLAASLDKAGVLDSLRLAKASVRGRFWRALGWLIVLMIVSMIAGSIPLIGSVFGAVTFAVAYQRLRGPERPEAAGPAWAWVAAGVLGLLWLPAFLYFSGKLDPKALAQLASLKPARELPEGIGNAPEPWQGVWLTEAEELKSVDGDGQGRVFVLDVKTAQVLRLGAGGAEEARWGDPAGRMRKAKDLAVDEAGNVFVACGSESTVYVDQDGRQSTGYNAVLKFDAQGAFLQEIPGPPGGSHEVACDKAGFLYLLDSAGMQVLKHQSADGALIGSFPLPDLQPSNAFYGLGFAAGGGKIFVSEMSAQRVRVLDAAGGSQVASFTLPAEKGAFYPASLAADAAGGAWVANGADWNLLRFGPAGELAGQLPWGGGGGPVMGEIADLYLDPQGTLHACEGFYGRVAFRR